MAKLIDFKCKYAAFAGISNEFVESLGLKLPDAYKSAESIAIVAAARRKADDNVFCVLPSDPVLEAEALGAKIKYDDSNLGPRKDVDVISTVDELANLPRIDLEHGRIAEVLKACQILKSQGEKVAIEVNGPFSIFNGLMEIQKILMAWRKKPELMQQIFDRIREDLVAYFVAAKNAGCDMLFYTDSAGGLNIIGPRYGKQYVEWFTLPLLKSLDETLPPECIVHLCPKTAFMVAGCGNAIWKQIPIDGNMKYGDACLSLAGKVRFMGQRCRKEENAPVSNHLCYLELTE